MGKAGNAAGGGGGVKVSGRITKAVLESGTIKKGDFVCTLNTNPSLLSKIELVSNGNGYQGNVGAINISENRVLVIYTNQTEPRATIFTINGESIFNSVHTVIAPQHLNINRLFPMSGGRYACFCGGYKMIVVITVIGDLISAVPTIPVPVTDAYGIEQLDDGLFVVTDEITTGKTRTFRINPDNSVTVGDKSTPSFANHWNCTNIKLSSTKFLHVYFANNVNQLMAVVGTVSGDSISFGVPTAVNSNPGGGAIEYSPIRIRNGVTLFYMASVSSGNARPVYVIRIYVSETDLISAEGLLPQGITSNNESDLIKAVGLSNNTAALLVRPVGITTPTVYTYDFFNGAVSKTGEINSIIGGITVNSRAWTTEICGVTNGNLLYCYGEREGSYKVTVSLLKGRRVVPSGYPGSSSLFGIANSGGVAGDVIDVLTV